MSRWIPAYVGLGSNLDDPATRIRQAFGALGDIPGTILVVHSPVYISAPMGPPDQPDFLNAVAGLLTRLAPADLLHALLDVETAHKRVRSETWGPRTLDLDLLMHGSSVSTDPACTLPHPSLHRRNFVLYPLADIAPALVVPGHGRVSQLADALGKDGLRLYQYGQ